MGLGADVNRETSGDFHARRCLLCRRVQSAEEDGQDASEWEDLAVFLDRRHLALSAVVVSDFYCDECTVFYRQLLTYGQPGQSVAGWTSYGPFTT